MIYILKHDYTHSGDSERDAFHMPFEFSDRFSVMLIDPKYSKKLPKQIFFRANFNVIPQYDYPLTDLGIPIMSKKMTDALQSLGAFDFSFIPVTMIDDTFFGELFNESGELATNVPHVNEYSAIQVFSRENIFDSDKSL